MFLKGSILMTCDSLTFHLAPTTDQHPHLLDTNVRILISYIASASLGQQLGQYDLIIRFNISTTNYAVEEWKICAQC